MPRETSLGKAMALVRESGLTPKKENLENAKIECKFCREHNRVGYLGVVETQEHDNPNFAKFRTCMTCGYQWAKEYWAWLKSLMGDN